MGLVYPFPWIVMHRGFYKPGAWQKCLVTHYEVYDSTKFVDVQGKSIMQKRKSPSLHNVSNGDLILC